MGVASGVVVRRYIYFLILLISTPLVSVLFCSSIPTFLLFVHFLKCFCSCILTESTDSMIHIRRI